MSGKKRPFAEQLLIGSAKRLMTNDDLNEPSKQRSGPSSSTLKNKTNAKHSMRQKSASKQRSGSSSSTVKVQTNAENMIQTPIVHQSSQSNIVLQQIFSEFTTAAGNVENNQNVSNVHDESDNEESETLNLEQPVEYGN